ncbi:hypothetical protein L6472_11405 [Prevotella sp. E13-17]|uniref:hypothetical protein n=1 Tax=Prevotella sp. E13-17 TaxID=2913616 RepID=UPI001EDC87E8|nr:hypothetical protein [Prevotella sp. E13-17]UKK50615.1 hypothetical protein L6472_11405 [Prevotella sp. E13-17]
MTRDILIYGGLCAISLDMIEGNGDIAKGLNDEYENRTNIKVRFDALTTGNQGEVLLVFLMGGDWNNKNINQNYVDIGQAYIITGDNGEDNLPYPFVGDLKYKKLLAIDYFEKMWRKNSDAIGGDLFVLKDIWYTANGMYVLVKFEV